MNTESVASWRLDLREVRSVGAIIATALALYRRYPLLFLLLAAGVVVPYEMIVLAVTGYGPLRQGHVPGVGGVVILPLLEQGFVGALVSALHIHAVALAGEGQRPTLREVARRTGPVLPAVLATSIVYGLATTIGFLLLIIPGVVLSLRWSVATQAAAIENRGWQQALKRSRELARERWSHIIGLFVATALIVTVFAIPADVLATGHGNAAGTVALGIAIATLRQSFTALTFALLYFDLAARPRLARTPPSAYDRPRDLDP
jgi:hypothetical protein